MYYDFYKILNNIINNKSLKEEVYDFVQNLINNSKVGRYTIPDFLVKRMVMEMLLLFWIVI